MAQPHSAVLSLPTATSLVPRGTQCCSSATGLACVCIRLALRWKDPSSKPKCPLSVVSRRRRPRPWQLWGPGHWSQRGIRPSLRPCPSGPLGNGEPTPLPSPDCLAIHGPAVPSSPPGEDLSPRVSLSPSPAFPTHLPKEGSGPGLGTKVLLLHQVESRPSHGVFAPIVLSPLPRLPLPGQLLLQILALLSTLPAPPPDHGSQSRSGLQALCLVQILHGVSE